jgi:hypothetical protein
MAAQKEDFLEEDPEIRSQKFVLLSFLSPENVLENKDQFFFGEFLKQYEIDYKMRNLETYIVSLVRGINEKLTKEADRLDAESVDLSGVSAICRKSRINMTGILETYQAYVKENDASIKKTTIKEAYDDFLYKNQNALEDAFFSKNNFQTTIRGLKVRGVTGTHGEAVALSKKLQRNDPIHNIFLGEVGKWLPWDPKPHQVQEQEYAEDQLNTLMKGYKTNEEAKDKFVSEQRKDGVSGAKKSAMPMSDATSLSNDGTAVVAGVAGVAGTAGTAGESSSDGWANMFKGDGDLALERKKAGITRADE